MKVAILVLLVAVGACSAAFSGSLVEKTRPLISQAGLRASIAASALTTGEKDSELSSLIQGIINSVVAQAEQLVEDIQSTIHGIGSQASVISTAAKAKIRAAVAALKRTLSLIGNNAQSTIAVQINSLISNLEGLLGGNSVAESTARGLFEQFNLQSLLQNALQAVLGQLAESQLVQNLIEQVTPFLDVLGLGDAIDQITSLLLGQTQLSRAAPKGLMEMIGHMQNIIQAVQDSAQSAIGAAQGLIAQAIAQGQTHASAAIDTILAQIDNLSFLGSLGLAQPLIEALLSIQSQLN